MGYDFMSYDFITISPPTDSITVPEAKLHARIVDSAEDRLVAGWISAAREYCQRYCDRAIGAQTIEIALDAFPLGAIEYIPLGPVAAITSIKYIDAAGAEQKLAAPNYGFSPYAPQGKIYTAYGVSWPVTRETPEAVRIRYAVGSATIPATVRQAMLLVITDFAENRQDTSEMQGYALPNGAKSLLRGFRTFTI